VSGRPRTVDVRAGRLLAGRIPGARYIELPGKDHLPFCDDADAILDEVEEFLTGVRRGPEPDCVLATVMFMDVATRPERRSSWATAALGVGSRRGGEEPKDDEQQSHHVPPPEAA
jgi:hypothetical protein